MMIRAVLDKVKESIGKVNWELPFYKSRGVHKLKKDTNLKEIVKGFWGTSHRTTTLGKVAVERNQTLTNGSKQDVLSYAICDQRLKGKPWRADTKS